MVIGVQTFDRELFDMVTFMNCEWTVLKVDEDNAAGPKTHDMLVIDMRNLDKTKFHSEIPWIGIGETFEQNLWALDNNCAFFIPLSCVRMHLYYSLNYVQITLRSSAALIVFPNGVIWDKRVNEITSLNRRVITLTPTESSILNVLWENQNTVVDAHTIIKEVWGHSIHARTEELYVYIRSLRSKIEINPKNPQMIRTKHRKGYLFSTQNLIQKISVS